MGGAINYRLQSGIFVFFGLKSSNQPDVIGWAKERRLPGDILSRGKDWTDEIKKSTGVGTVAVLSLEFSNGSWHQREKILRPSNS